LITQIKRIILKFRDIKQIEYKFKSSLKNNNLINLNNNNLFQGN